MQWKPRPFVPIPEGVWHPYFAWLPTDCEDGTVVWLGWCERKFEHYREIETYYRVLNPNRSEPVATPAAPSQGGTNGKA